MSDHHHRSGPLKQANKKHKAGRHLTKTAIGKKAGGKLDNSNRKGWKSSSFSGKKERLHRAKQIRQHKKEEIWLRQRRGGMHGSPKVVGIIALGETCDFNSIQQSIIDSASCSYKSSVGAYKSNCVTVGYAQHKQRFTLLRSERDVVSVLDVAKVADILLFVLPLHDGTEKAVDELGDSFLSAIRSQGMPSTIGVVQGLNSFASKAQGDMRKYAQRFFQTEFGDDIKIADMDNQIQLVRALISVQPKSIHWRDMRSYMLIDSADAVPSSEDPTVGTLLVSGYISGQPLSVNQLVHITDVGTFQMSKIVACTDPNVIKEKGISSVDNIPNKKSSSLGNMEMDENMDHNSNNVNHNSNNVEDHNSNLMSNNGEILAVANSELQEDLQLVADVDPFASEQTWPTEEELAEASACEPSKVNKLPSGLSDYQASWFPVDSEGNIVADEEDGEFIKMDDDMDMTTQDDQESDEEMNEVDDQVIQLSLSKKRDMEADEMQFPDEIDIPSGKLARNRLARYRGLKSFRTSPWDPKECLPQDYACIYQFKDYCATQKTILDEVKQLQNVLNKQLVSNRTGSKKDILVSTDMNSSVGENCDMDVVDHEGVVDLEGVVPTGTYVVLYIEKVPMDALAMRNSSSPMILGSLFKHENRLGVLNFNVQKTSACVDPVKSKEEMVIHCGFRRYLAKPIFSDNNLNCGKHKFQRFLLPGGWFGASCYGPASFQPAPVLMFRYSNDVLRPNGEFVASGTLLGVNADRIILKRIVLTGVPVKVKKRRAVVRYMFHNPEDIRWFSPVELTTKCGITGHIKESLGTHGDFKAIFSKPIQQNDTVCMNLYKRVYPKFFSTPKLDIK